MSLQYRYIAIHLSAISISGQVMARPGQVCVGMLLLMGVPEIPQGFTYTAVARLIVGLLESSL